MRYREPFTIFPRKMNSGRVIWYYQAYDNSGRRITARSTGQLSKGAARTYCNRLFKEDALIPKRGENIVFEKYAEDWWVWDKCEYIKYRRSRRELSRNYVNSARMNLIKHIIPYFGKMKLESVKSYDIEKWLLGFSGKGLSNPTANLNLTYLKIMLSDAVRRGLLDINEAEKVAPLKNNARVRDILSSDEISSIFDYDSIERIWEKEIYYLANLLSACTGLRCSEVSAVRGDKLFDGYISVSDQYHCKYGLIPTKTRDSRLVPLPAELQKMLEIQSVKNERRYLFSLDGGETPLNNYYLNLSLKKAMLSIGISKQEQKKRNLCFHSWRHFFNTEMRTNNISDSKLQKLTGHKSLNMTDHYTHYKVSDFDDVKKIQSNIIKMPKKAG